MQHEYYRPYYYDRMAAGVDARGKPVAWSHRVVGPAILARYLPPAFRNGIDPDGVDARYSSCTTSRDPGRIRAARGAGLEHHLLARVGPTHNVFVTRASSTSSPRRRRLIRSSIGARSWGKAPRARADARPGRESSRLGKTVTRRARSRRSPPL